nr:S8/S53 family peptidase [Nakamurella flavida]
MDSTDTPGVPFPDLGHTRRAVPGDADTAPGPATRRQTALLGSSSAAQAALRRQIDLVQERRRRRGLDHEEPGDAIAFEIVDRGRAEPLLVVNELLMLAADVDGSYRGFRRGPVDDLLADHGLSATPVPELDGRIVRLQRTPEPLPVDTLREVAARLRALGYPASLTTVTPLGPILKGEGAAEPAEGLPFPGDVGVWSPAMAVAVIDSGVTAIPRTDGWLTGLATGTNTDPLDAFPLDAPDGYLDFGAGHGTFVAGIVQQIAPSADIRVLRAVDSDGIGSEVTVAVAMLRAAADGARILNLSLGSETEDDQPPPALRVALDLLAERHPDVLVVAAAGNSDSTHPCWPAAFRDVVAVGALGVDRRRAPYSNHGHWVDCATVGSGVLSTYVEGTENPQLSPAVDPSPDTYGPDPWATWTGTSFAAPQIVGALARLLGADPTLTPRAALREVLSRGVPVPGLGVAVEILPGS